MPSNFTATTGWEDLFKQVKIDQGGFYASKDNVYPTKDGGKRRINWGWARVPPGSTQNLPREVTFNPVTRQLQQLPIEELAALRGDPTQKDVDLNNNSVAFGLNSIIHQSEVVATFMLPSTPQKFGLMIGEPNPTVIARMMKGFDMPGNDIKCVSHPTGTDPSVCQAACDADDQCKAWTMVSRNGHEDCCTKDKLECPKPNSSCTSGAKTETSVDCDSGTNLKCEIDFVPPTSHEGYYEVGVSCGGNEDTLRLIPTETTVEIRMFLDVTFAEIFFQQGRVAMTNNIDLLLDNTDLRAYSNGTISASTTSYPIGDIWVTPAEVRAAPRVYQYK